VNRFPVAIKHPKNLGEDEMRIFFEEAKSMLEIKDYHENIVNLQGIIYGRENVEKKLPKV
jgi:hypothetical protein